MFKFLKNAKRFLRSLNIYKNKAFLIDTPSLNTMISVVIAAYNAENYIEKVLDAILAQTLLPDEIVIVNDGSLDKTLNVIR